MKKLVSLLLVFVMLLGILCSCNDTDKNTNIPSDDANTPSDEDKPSDEANKPNEEDKPSDEANTPSDEENTPNDETNKPSNEDEPTEIPSDPSALDYFACEQVGGYNTFRNGSITYDAEVLFGCDSYCQYYAYVPAWDAYFQVAPMPEYEVPVDALISGDYLFVISATPEGDNVTTYRFSKDGNLVESYSCEFSLSYSYGYNETWLYNWYQEDLLYAFFLEDTMKKSETTDYVLHKFQSTDHGKTWTQVQADQLEFTYCNMEIVRLFTNDLGVIFNSCMDGDVYVTYDGGGTWNVWNILELPYPDEWGRIKSFNLESITYEDNQYIIALVISSEKAPFQIYKFVSKDFINWELQ